MRNWYVAGIALFAVLAVTPGADARVAERASPPGQVSVVTINARQRKVLSSERFDRLFELARALRNRPAAWDGGHEGGVLAPDVIVFQETRVSNLEVFERLLDQRYSYKYKMVESTDDVVVGFLINTTTVTLSGDPVTWTDPCKDGTDSEEARNYQFIRLTENATGTPFTVAGVYLKPRYPVPQCKERNAQELRDRLAAEPGATVIGGDFNRRAVQLQHECDPDERSAPLPWWSIMTSPTDLGRAYTDTVWATHRRDHIMLTAEWTHKQKSAKVACDEAERVRLNRIDYLFAYGLEPAEAHADHPGWAGGEPVYSDHRFVWGRFVLGGPPRPARPTTIEGKDGVVEVSWEAAEVTKWILYRALRGNDYRVVARLDPTTTSFVDRGTRHDAHYRYALAPVGLDTSQGFESRPGWATADARGPHVIDVFPNSGQSLVSRKATIRVEFDEAVDVDSVDQDTIELIRGQKSVSGRVEKESRRVVTFDPSSKMRRRQEYRVSVDPTKDLLGNRGPRFSFSFETGR